MFPYGSAGQQPTVPQNQYQPPNTNGTFGGGWEQSATQPPTHCGYPPQQSINPYPTGPTYPHQTTNSAAYPNYGQAAPVGNHQPYPVSTTPLIPQLPPTQYNHQHQHQPNQGYIPSQIPTNHSQTPFAGQPSAQPVYPHNGHGHVNGQGHVAPGGNLPKSFGAMNIQQTINIQKGTPTVRAAPNFDPVKDAHALRKAMKGFGTDEDVLIDIICKRTNCQRQEIQLQFKKYFGRDLIDDVISETSGNFEKVLVGLLRPTVDFHCEELHKAFKGIGTDEGVLIETLCTLSNMEIRAIKDRYLQIYNANLESELRSETSGNFKKLLTSLCTAARDESDHLNPEAAKNDAKELLKAGEQRMGTDESVFNMILCQRNYHQLKLIFQEYINLQGHSLEDAINTEFSGDIKEGLLAIYKCATNKPQYLASRLYKSMVGLGTKDKHLIRVLITRCEIDMQDIKTAFEGLYGKSLKSWIKGEASGDYRNALLALIGETK